MIRGRSYQFGERKQQQTDPPGNLPRRVCCHRIRYAFFAIGSVSRRKILNGGTGQGNCIRKSI